MSEAVSADDVQSFVEACWQSGAENSHCKDSAKCAPKVLGRTRHVHVLPFLSSFFVSPPGLKAMLATVSASVLFCCESVSLTMCEHACLCSCHPSIMFISSNMRMCFHVHVFHVQYFQMLQHVMRFHVHVFPCSCACFMIPTSFTMSMLCCDIECSMRGCHAPYMTNICFALPGTTLCLSGWKLPKGPKSP